MTEQRRKQIVFAALVLAVIYGIWNFTLGRKSTVLLPPDQATAPVAAATAGTKESVDVKTITSNGWGRDPFRGSVLGNSQSAEAPTTTATVSDRVYWILSGIVYNDQHPLAVINQNPVSIGDTVDGARVIKIERSKVTLEKNGNRFDLYVSKG